VSYCRFSTDNFGCDVYCYVNDAGAFVTIVAAVRFVGDSPIPVIAPIEEWGLAVSFNEVARQMDERQAWMDGAERAPIGLWFDGEEFVDATAGEAAERLEMLRAAGYRVPQRAIDVLREEAVAGAGGEGAEDKSAP